MAANFKTVRVALNTSTGTQDITISGFGTPKAAIFYYNVNTDDDTIFNLVRLSEGYTDGTNQAVTAITSADGQSTTNCKRAVRNDAVIAAISTSSYQTRANFDSWVTDGVRINITTAPSAARFVTVVLINGDDVLSTFAGTPTLSSTSTVVNVGFEASLVVMSTVGQSVNPASPVDQSIFSSGFAVNDGSDTNAGVFSSDQTALSTSNSGSYTSDQYSVGEVFNNTLNWGGSVGSYTGTGFTVTTTVSPSTDVIALLAIELDTGAQAKIVNYDSPTSAGARNFTGSGFTPSFVMMQTSNNTSLDTNQDGTAVGTFVADDTNQYTNTHTSLDNVSTSVCKILTKSGGLAQLNGNSKQFDSTFTSFNSDGCEINFSVVDGTIRKWTALYIGEVSSGITVTGTAVPTQTEADVVTGGKTIILTVAGDTFVTGSSSEDGIAGGSDSDIGASGTNWDSLIKTTLDNTDVVLSGGNTIATITLPAFATYDIPGTETITWTIPAASLTTSATPVVATPTHTITAVVSGFQVAWARNANVLLN